MRRSRRTRSALSAGGSGSAASTVGLVGARSFDGSNYFTTNDGIAGVIGGFWISTLFTITGQTGSATRTVFRSITALSGWVLRTTGAHANISFIAAGTDTVGVISTAGSLAGSIGKIYMVVGVHDGSNVRLYLNRVEVTPAVAITGYAAPTAINRLGDGVDQMTIFGGAGGHDVPSLAEVQAYFDDVKTARRPVSMAGVTTDRVWATNKASTITDAVSGSATMTVTGALSTRRQPLVWGW